LILHIVHLVHIDGVYCVRWTATDLRALDLGGQVTV